MAGEADAERLVVLLEARIRDFERNMAKASGTADKSFSRMRRDSRSATRQMEADMVRSTSRVNQALAMTSTKIGAFGKSFAAGALVSLAPILSVAAAVEGAKTAMAEFGDISDRAAEAGLDPEWFQGFAHQAKLAGVEMSEFSSAVATFAKNAGLAVEGKGRMVTALKALNPELLEAIRNATTQEQRVRLAADALNDEADAAKRAAIAAALFGDSGIVLAKAFEGGAAALEASITKAKELGLVVDRELIARAEQLGDEFDTTTKIVDLQLKQALVNLGPILLWLSGLAANVAGAIGSAVEGTKALQDQSTANLEGQLAALNAAGAANPLGLPTDIFGVDAAKRAELEAELRRRAVDNLRTQLTSKPPETADIPTLEETESRNAAAAAAVKQAEAVKTLIDNLEFERSLVGLSATEQAVLTTQRQAGAAATDEQKARIAALVEETAAERQQVEALQAAYDQLRSIGESALNSLIDAMADGKIEGEELLGVLSDIVGQLGQMFVKNAFDIMGGGGFNIGSLFGFASGTANTGGRRGDVRGVVHGQEAVIPLPTGGKVPVEIKAAPSTTSTFAPTINYAPTVNISGGASRSEVAAAMRQAKKEFAAELPTMLGDARKRGKM